MLVFVAGIDLKMLNSLLKPRLSLAVLVTIIPGLMLGTSLPSAELVIYTMVGAFLMATSSFLYNQLMERHRDAKMERTQERALPSGKLSVPLVTTLASSTLAGGFLLLYMKVNLAAALVTLLILLLYVFLYTAILKPRTEHNTVVGGLAGSLGPLIGEAAVTGGLSIHGFLLFMLLFIWQPPHFYALAIFLKDDYEAADFPMLPVKRGITHTVKQIIIYNWILLAAVVAVFYPFQSAGLYFLIPAVLAWMPVMYLSYRLKKTEDPVTARRVFLFSILHLIVWHIAFSVDLYVNRSYITM